MEENIAVQEDQTANAEQITKISDLERKMQFTGTVVGTSLAGAFVDIGVEVPGVVHISQLQEEPVNRVEDVVEPGQTVAVWVRNVIPSKKRVDLTMIEPLPLEWREINKDMVVEGKITRLEKFGVFVDIGAERPGLVHISEITHGYIKSPEDVVKEGDEVEVKVLSVNRRRKQIKLSMKAAETLPEEEPKPVRNQNKAEDVEVLEEEVIPTAMEMAFREAMERSNEVTEETSEKTKSSAKNDDYNDIMDRTLENRVKSTN